MSSYGIRAFRERLEGSGDFGLFGDAASELARCVADSLCRSAPLHDGLRRKELIPLIFYPALTPSARKRASGRAGLTWRRA